MSWYGPRATGKGRRKRSICYLTGGKVEASLEEKFKNLFATIEVYNKNEQLGIIGGLKKAHLPMLDPEERKWTFAGGGAGIQDQ